MQLPQRLIDKDDLDVILCVLKTPIFRNFLVTIQWGSFPRSGKNMFFFSTAAPPTGDLWKIQSPTFVEDIFLSQCAEFQEN